MSEERKVEDLFYKWQSSLDWRDTPFLLAKLAYRAGYAQATTDLTPTYEALERAAIRVVNNLPDYEIELAREAWGNTNTAVIYHWINNLRKVLGKPLIGEQAEADAARKE